MQTKITLVEKESQQASDDKDKNLKPLTPDPFHSFLSLSSFLRTANHQPAVEQRSPVIVCLKPTEDRSCFLKSYDTLMISLDFQLPFIKVLWTAIQDRPR